MQKKFPTILAIFIYPKISNNECGIFFFYFYWANYSQFGKIIRGAHYSRFQGTLNQSKTLLNFPSQNSCHSPNWSQKPLPTAQCIRLNLGQLWSGVFASIPGICKAVNNRRLDFNVKRRVIKLSFFRPISNIGQKNSEKSRKLVRGKKGKNCQSKG